MSIGVILIADNIVRYADTRAEILRREGYEVFCAYSIDQARDILRNRWIHLALIDIRLTDDEDEEDTSGLDLAKEPEFEHVAKLILTGFPTIDYVREALTPEPGRNHKILKFRSKKEPIEEILSDVREIFENYIHINRQLKIHWRTPTSVSLTAVVALLAPVDFPEDIGRYYQELDELLRSTFHDCDQITISRLLWSKQGRLALDVTSFTENMVTQLVLQIRHTPVQQGVGLPLGNPKKTTGLLTPPVIYQGRSAHFEALTWRLDAPLENFSPMTWFVRENSEKRIVAALENLYQNALSPWYQSHLNVIEGDLAEAYQKLIGIPETTNMPVDFDYKLEQLLKSCMASKIIVDFRLEPKKIWLKFYNSDKEYFFSHPNIVSLSLTEGGHIVRRISSPGNIVLHALLVDRMANVMMTDFAYPVLVPCETDFITLELDARVLECETENVLALLEMERELSRMKELTDGITVANFDLDYRRSLIMILNIRRLAYQTFQSRIFDYSTGVFYLSLQRLDQFNPGLRYTTNELIHFFHYLLICCGLVDPNEEAQGVHKTNSLAVGLYIDQANHEVFLNGRLISLTPTEYDLLAFLYIRQGNLCRREEIMKDVFKISEPDPFSEKSLLNTHMGRLRTKIEIDAGNPRYILTIRGQGYKLVCSPE